MHSLVRKLLDTLGHKSIRRERRTRLGVELLEDRTVPVAGTGSVSGSVFLNTAANGIAGAAITLNGTPTSGPAIPVNLTAVTDANGAFAFTGLPEGNYQLATGPFAGLIGTISFGGVSSSPGVNVGTNLNVGTGPSAGQNFTIVGGIDPNFISIAMFLNTTNPGDFPVGGAAPGLGRPDNIPFVTTPIGQQALSATTTSKVIDLAGHFTNNIISDSAVTMNISHFGVAKTINLTLHDTTTPQAVANFFDYVDSGAYDNTFFHRETKADSFLVLQGGGATVSPGGTLAEITSLGTIPDEVIDSHTAGTIAVANTGAANSGSSEFFFNVEDNSAELDKGPLQPVGFTVFGEVADAASLAVLEDLAASNVFNLSATAFAGTAGLSAAQVPLDFAVGATVTDFPTDASKYLVINSIVTSKRDDFLTYSIINNSNPTLVTAVLTNEKLTIARGTGTGSAVITVEATDRFGATVTTTFTVVVS